MPLRRTCNTLVLATGLAALLLTAACVEEYRPWWLGGTRGTTKTASGNVFMPGGAAVFSEVLLDERTFIQGQVVVTGTYHARDMTRSPIQVDFNNDGRIDPVVGYRQQDLGVVQILMSYTDSDGALQHASLTLDGGDNEWESLTDVAVGDIDGDGNFDLVIATAEGVIYLRHPNDSANTHVLSEWGATEGELEIIEGTAEALSTDEVDAIIASVLGPGVNANDYTTSVSETYTNVEIADFDNDGHNDVAAARSISITLSPKTTIGSVGASPGTTTGQSYEFVGGSIQILLNPGRARDGLLWTGVPVGFHERHGAFDREGATDVEAVDLDNDGDLDLITTAAKDQNVQIAWFENPGGPGGLNVTQAWTQHRIGSLRDATRISVADFSGDGRVDVAAISDVESVMALFIQPEEGPSRGYDWYSSTIVEFESYVPYAVQGLDVDNDGVLELVVGGSNGAVRYFEPPADITETWVGRKIITHEGSGSVGLLGYGDLDGDGDADLVTVVQTADGSGDKVSWIRNQLR